MPEARHPSRRPSAYFTVTRPALLLLALSAAACTSTPVVTGDAPTSTHALATSAPRAPREPRSQRGAPTAIRYLALGDSFTAGTGSRPDDAFPVRLVARLRARGAAVALENLGVNGYTTDDLVARELPRVASFAPTLVTLAIGANDLVRGSSLERYRAQVRGILAAIVTAGVPAGRVYVLPQPDWSRSPAAADFGDPGALRAKIEAFNDALQAEAAAVGARWVDLFPRMREEAQAGMIAADGLHPAARAYDEWAEALVGGAVEPARGRVSRESGVGGVAAVAEARGVYPALGEIAGDASESPFVQSTSRPSLSGGQRSFWLSPVSLSTRSRYAARGLSAMRAVTRAVTLCSKRGLGRPLRLVSLLSPPISGTLKRTRSSSSRPM